MRCDRCGRGKFIGFDELGEIHLRYVKGLPGPYSIATSEWDRAVQQQYQGEPLTDEEYYAEVEKWAGAHKGCGGQYRFEAPARCPKCGSEEIEMDSPDVLYD